MIVMASARDLITIFVALETITIPTFVLAGWRKHDTKSNEAAIKYFLIGVLSSAMMLYGMSLVFGDRAARRCSSDIARLRRANGTAAAVRGRDLPHARRVRVQGRARCRSTSGRPTPTRARPPRSPRSCRSRRRPAGSSRCSRIIRFGFFPSQDSWQPVLWVLAAASMIFGNLVALRQTNIVRMLAYSSIAQGGFILVPLAVAGDGDAARVVVRGRRHLPPHLRRDEPRRVRGGDRGRAPHRARRDRLVRRPGPDRARRSR